MLAMTPPNSHTIVSYMIQRRSTHSSEYGGRNNIGWLSTYFHPPRVCRRVGGVCSMRGAVAPVHHRCNGSCRRRVIVSRGVGNGAHTLIHACTRGNVELPRLASVARPCAGCWGARASAAGCPRRSSAQLRGNIGCRSTPIRLVAVVGVAPSCLSACPAPSVCRCGQVVVVP